MRACPLEEPTTILSRHELFAWPTHPPTLCSSNYFLLFTGRERERWNRSNRELLRGKLWYDQSSELKIFIIDEKIYYFLNSTYSFNEYSNLVHIKSLKNVTHLSFYQLADPHTPSIQVNDRVTDRCGLTQRTHQPQENRGAQVRQHYVKVHAHSN